MTNFSVSGLARKWCPAHGGPPRRPLEEPPLCHCAAVAGAIREALAEAEKTIMELEFVVDEDPFQRWTTKGGSFAKQGSAAIAALKGASG